MLGLQVSRHHLLWGLNHRNRRGSWPEPQYKDPHHDESREIYFGPFGAPGIGRSSPAVPEVMAFPGCFTHFYIHHEGDLPVAPNTDSLRG